jgi:SAM-dependent methyltransferase
MVIDKYEIFPGVINKDIEDIYLNDKFDLIISISTIEHIGLDDCPIDPEKVIRTLKKLKTKFLKKNGIILVSFPVNYNEKISEMINKNKISNFEIFCFRKINEKYNLWKEVDYKEVKENKHSQPVKAVCFLKLTNKTKIE